MRQPQHKLLALLAVLSLTACGGQHDELQAWMDQQRQEVKPNVQPLIAALLAFWCLKETLTARMLSGLVIGFAGVVVLAFPDLQFDGGHATGALYVVGAALGTALGNVLLKRRSGSDS